MGIGKKKESASQASIAPKDINQIIRSGMDTVEEGILVVEGSGRIGYHNLGFREMWSLDQDRLAKLTEAGFLAWLADFLVSPSIISGIADEKAPCGIRGQVCPAKRLELRDGRVMELRHGPIGDKGAEDRLYIFRDVSQRAKTEQSLREREDILSSMFKVVPVGIGVVQGRRVREMNEHLCSITGYSRDECLGRDARMFYADEGEYLRVAQMYADLDRGQSRSERECLWRRKDGEMVHIRLSAAPLEPGSPARGYSVAVEDITERRRAEAALVANQHFLNETQSVAQIGSWELEVKSGRLTWSDESYRIYGYEPGDIEPDLDLLMGKLALSEDLPIMRAHMDRSLREGVFSPFEYRIRCGGEIKWLHITGAIRRGSSGEIVRMIGTQQDISWRKANEEKRLDLERRLLYAQKLESLGILAGGIAHDFNNILMAILGNLDLIKMQCGLDSELRANVDQSISAVHRAASLTRQMLDYSGKASFKPVALDLNEMIRAQASLLEAGLPKNGELRFELADGLPKIWADAGQLQHVLANLVTNSAEAISDRGGRIIVATGMQRLDPAARRRLRSEASLPPGDYVCLTVSDDGCGMAETTRQRLFDPFFSTKFMGRGLGMSAVLGIVRSHRGAIDVDSEYGRGTRVQVFLSPYGAVDEGGQGDDPESKDDSGKPPVARLLVVDDEEGVRNVCAKILARLGWEVDLAANGQEAIDILLKDPERIACVLLDLSMPVMDGITAFTRLREIRPGLRIIMSTGYNSDREDVERLLRRGVSGFIQKPYDSESLRAELSRVMGGPG